MLSQGRLPLFNLLKTIGRMSPNWQHDLLLLLGVKA